MTSVWSRFRHDPRAPEHAGLRASDGDREVVHAVLAEAYGDGRLTSAEHDRRADALWQAVTLGDLLRLLDDLVPVHESLAPAPPPPAPLAGPSLRRQLAWFVVPSLLCTLLWLYASHALFWPLWVIVYTGIPPLRTLLRRSRRRSRRRRAGMS